MRKGEAKRQEMLAASERLFLSKGYDATSVQDILDVLHASKSGFYHHFASKEEVLKLLCAQRAERAAVCAAGQLEAARGDMARINAVLYAFMPLRIEEAEFLRMLTPLIERSEGRAMAMIYQDALRASFLPLLAQEIAAAAVNGTVYPTVRGMEEMVLHLVNHCWMRIVSMLSEAAREGGRVEAGTLLTEMERYRRAVEVLLDAPYGSVELVRVEELSAVCDTLRS